MPSTPSSAAAWGVAPSAAYRRWESRHAGWRVNRPHGGLSLDTVLAGILDFAGEFGGKLLTETMLIDGFNDDAESVEEVVTFLHKLAPRRAYLAVPTRPPAAWAMQPAGEAAVVRAYEIMREKLPSVELLASGEEGLFGRTGDAAEDLLAILAVHPMRETTALRYLGEAGGGQGLLEDLVRGGRVRRTEYRGRAFVTRRHPPA